MSMALAKIKTAMTEYPEMFSGEGRFDLDLMRSGQVLLGTFES